MRPKHFTTEDAGEHRDRIQRPTLRLRSGQNLRERRARGGAFRGRPPAATRVANNDSYHTSWHDIIKKDYRGTIQSCANEEAHPVGLPGIGGVSLPDP